MRYLIVFLMMKYQELKKIVLIDLYRHTGKSDNKTLMYQLKYHPGFMFMFYLRLCQFCNNNKNLFLRPIVFWYVQKKQAKYSSVFNIQIPWTTEIGPGFVMGHSNNSGIVIYGKVKIGQNCTIYHQVTLGKKSRGDYEGFPTIGDNVYIGPGAKIIGNVKIGNNVAIGANCVVTKDIPDNAVVVGVPGKVISYNGSEGYINFTNCEIE